MERDRICAAEIWCECFLGEIKNLKRSDSMEINSILATIPGWKKYNKSIKFGSVYGVQKGYKRSEVSI